jgi:hypothetical protein
MEESDTQFYTVFVRTFEIPFYYGSEVPLRQITVPTIPKILKFKKVDQE